MTGLLCYLPLNQVRREGLQWVILRHLYFPASPVSAPRRDPGEIAGFILEFLDLVPGQATRREPTRRTATDRAALALA